jgi:hypothetical protein
MSRTFNDDADCHGADNLAQDYMTFDDASPVPVPRPHMADGTLMNAAGGCVTDLLTYYAALMSAAKDQLASGKISTENSPLKQVAQLLSSATNTAPSLRERSYAHGWARTQLPGVLGETSRNEAHLPVMGNPDHPRLVVYHHGMLVGISSAVCLFPESDTAIVLLSNCVVLDDGPGGPGHLLMETMFEDPVKHHFVALVREAADAAGEVVPRIEKQLDGQRGDVVKPKRLDRYVGKYCNEVRTFCVCVREREDGLWTNFQGNEVENYRLRHYGGDVF